MNKPNLDTVKKLLESDGWDVSLIYGDCEGSKTHGGINIRLDANKIVKVSDTRNAAESFRAYFGYRDEDAVNAPGFRSDKEAVLESIAEYRNIWGDKVIYEGTPGAVQLYEKEFGVSSAADIQTMIGNGKKVKDVEAAFKAEGYMVALSPSDPGTDMEMWQIDCTKISPYEVLVAAYGYSDEWLETLSEGNAGAAAAYKTKVRIEDYYFYYGTPGAMRLFECIGKDGKVDKAKLAEPLKVEAFDDGRPKILTALEEAFKAAGYPVVSVTPTRQGTPEESWQVSCVKPEPYDLLIAGLGPSEEWAKEMGGYNDAAAKSFNTTVKYRGNLYYLGTTNAEKIFESL